MEILLLYGTSKNGGMGARYGELETDSDNASRTPGETGNVTGFLKAVRIHVRPAHREQVYGMNASRDLHDYPTLRIRSGN